MVAKIFISYIPADRAWAEWIAWQIRETGYEPSLQAGHFRESSDFVQKMQRTVRESGLTIAVLSPQYEQAALACTEWAAAFAQDDAREAVSLVPVRVEGYRPSGLFARIAYVDLVELDETAARDRLLQGLREAGPPSTARVYSGGGHSDPAGPQRRFPADRPPRWNVPFARNPYFTGREQLLDELAQALATDDQTRMISGPGGVGKTETAVEFAYRYRDRYEAVFWIRSDTAAEVRACLRQISQLLDLDESDALDEDVTAQAVHRWLEQNRAWLLVFDNADDPAELQALVPPRPRGHVLLTSRAHTLTTLDIGEPLQMEILPREESVAFLRRRAQRETLDPEEATAANDLAEELGDLPLALEQAGAFISQRDNRIQDYLKSYRKRSHALLDQVQPTASEKRSPVTITWDLNLQAVEEESPAAADLLRASAFFAPDSIPFELLMEGGSELGETLATALEGAGEDCLVVENLLHPLFRYSLIGRNAEARAFNVHRLVQELLKQAMDKPAAAMWAGRAIRAVGRALPSADFENWPSCERLQPHVRVAAEFGSETEEASIALHKAALYCAIRRRYREAEPLFQQSLAICERVLGSEHAEVGITLTNLANLYRSQRRLEEAEPLFLRAMVIYEKTLDPEHPEVGITLNSLALLYSDQFRLEEAEPLLLRSLAIREKALGPEHRDVATALNNLAELYHGQGRSEEAEQLFQQSLEIFEKILGPEHPEVATTLNNLAELYRDQRRFQQAAPLFQRSMTIYERVFGIEHPSVATSLDNQAQLCHSQGRYGRAEPRYQRALAIREKVYSPEHPDIAITLNNLAALYRIQGRFEEAEPLFQRALTIWKNGFGSDHPYLAKGLFNYAALLRQLGRKSEAAEMEARARKIHAHPTRGG